MKLVFVCGAFRVLTAAQRIHWGLRPSMLASLSMRNRGGAITAHRCLSAVLAARDADDLDHVIYDLVDRYDVKLWTEEYAELPRSDVDRVARSVAAWKLINEPSRTEIGYYPIAAQFVDAVSDAATSLAIALRLRGVAVNDRENAMLWRLGTLDEERYAIPMKSSDYFAQCAAYIESVEALYADLVEQATRS